MEVILVFISLLFLLLLIAIELGLISLYFDWLMHASVPPVVVRNDEWTWEEVCYYLYEEKAFDNIVISPGPGSPTCAADIGICCMTNQLFSSFYFF